MYNMAIVLWAGRRNLQCIKSNRRRELKHIENIRVHGFKKYMLVTQIRNIYIVVRMTYTVVMLSFVIGTILFYFFLIAATSYLRYTYTYIYIYLFILHARVTRHKNNTTRYVYCANIVRFHSMRLVKVHFNLF